ncbi:hypothetical protein [Moorella sp. Hama-1]|uniref:hypothetical protein n=1 Tax=Moorella sp. Hama-1 TaxID=2138101 RepID=UPI000D65C06B|nr:hypothetical protein [Moorella sp. Hama-1]MDN5360973.1 hypothetical protein [Moorella sp. (in: firmicutes)]BCV20290.1 hypothetical protein hamaS1_03590 [Moorella sp. Hama-1]
MAVYPDREEDKLPERSAEGSDGGRHLLEREEEFDLETPAVLAKIEGQLHRNLKALRHLSEDLDDPHARGTVQRLLRDLQARQREIATLRQLMIRYPELGNLARVRQRLSLWLQSSNTRSFLLGAGLSLVVLALLPLARKNFRPLVVKAMREIMELSDKSQELVAGLKEGLEDLVSEAQFEAMKQSLEPAAGETTLPAPGPEK